MSKVLTQEGLNKLITLVVAKVKAADTKAEGAKTKAEDADGKATQAKTDASEAKTKAEGADQKAEANKLKIAEIEAKLPTELTDSEIEGAFNSVFGS